MPERAKVIAAVQESWDECAHLIRHSNMGQYGVTNLLRLEQELVARLAGSDPAPTDEAFSPEEYGRLAALIGFALTTDSTMREADIGAEAFAAATVQELLGLQARLLRLAGGAT